MVSGFEDIGGESGLGILPGAWNRCGGDQSGDVSWPAAAAESECELRCFAELAAGLRGHAGVSLAGSCPCPGCGEGAGVALRGASGFGQIPLH